MQKKYFIQQCCCSIIAAVLFGCSENSVKKELFEAAPIQVEVGKLQEMMFQKSILVQGNIQSIDDAVISAKIAGTIEELNVSEGDKVKKGEILFQIDRKNLENQLQSAEQNLAVAKENCKTVEQDIKIAQTNLHKAALDYERAKKLVSSKAISQTAFDATEAEWNRNQAVLKKENTVLEYNLVKVQQAETNLKIARKNLEDSVIRSPFDGVVTDKFQEPGEYVNSGTKVLMIENLDKLEVICQISAVYYDMISKNTSLIVYVDGKELCRVKVSFISPTIDPISRTFKLKAKLPENKNLICGSLCDIKIILAERMGKGIINDAVLARSGGRSSIFTAKDGKAEELFIKSGFSSDGYTEILDSDKIGDLDIVISGQYFLNPNDKLEIKN